ncbi:alpha-ketoglutarate-dependent dioxygenase AlkB family protein [Polyangium fumosum]|uniref:alpha-ketoglutarate-dependent dioxygenase AlkB family protein n=1 Tax=Polyangium fumosum TaxID=889272 RepID=UPI001B862A7F|nr:alpha-ketoglutarate-dependent dioxygenase AlkB [Polyangium fumosum]
MQPRLSAWHGDEGASYTYSGLSLTPNPWTPALSVLRARVEAAAGCTFNSVLVNHSRDGDDSMGKHADDEPELGENPVIASLSLGARRKFVLEPKKKGEEKVTLELGEGRWQDHGRASLLATGRCQRSRQRCGLGLGRNRRRSCHRLFDELRGAQFIDPESSACAGPGSRGG